MALMVLMSANANGQPAAPSYPAVADIEIAGQVLMVTDLERSLRFYQRGLGLVVGTKLPGNPGPGATIITRAASRTPFLLLRQQTEDEGRLSPVQPGNSLNRLMLVVADSDAVAARLDGEGYTHTPINDRKIFFVSDPDGYRLEIMQRSSKH